MGKCINIGEKRKTLQASKEISTEIKKCVTVLHSLDITTVIHLSS